MTEVVASPPIRVVSVAQQGPAGPAGPTGPSPAGKSGIFVKFPEAETIPICASSADEFTINGVRGLRVASGSMTLSYQINGVDVEGLAGVAVTTTAQQVVATGDNTVAVGDRVTIIFSDVTNATDLEFTTY